MANAPMPYAGSVPFNDPYAPNTDPAMGPTYNSSTKIPDVGAGFRPSESNPSPPNAGVVMHGPKDRMPPGAPASGQGMEPPYSKVILPRN